MSTRFMKKIIFLTEISNKGKIDVCLIGIKMYKSYTIRLWTIENTSKRHTAEIRSMIFL